MINVRKNDRKIQRDEGKLQESQKHKTRKVKSFLNRTIAFPVRSLTLTGSVSFSQNVK